MHENPAPFVVRAIHTVDNVANQFHCAEVQKHAFFMRHHMVKILASDGRHDVVEFNWSAFIRTNPDWLKTHPQANESQPNWRSQDGQDMGQKICDRTITVTAGHALIETVGVCSGGEPLRQQQQISLALAKEIIQLDMGFRARLDETQSGQLRDIGFLCDAEENWGLLSVNSDPLVNGQGRAAAVLKSLLDSGVITQRDIENAIPGARGRRYAVVSRDNDAVVIYDKSRQAYVHGRNINQLKRMTLEEAKALHQSHAIRIGPFNDVVVYEDSNTIIDCVREDFTSNVFMEQVRRAREAGLDFAKAKERAHDAIKVRDLAFYSDPSIEGKPDGHVYASQIDQSDLVYLVAQSCDHSQEDACELAETSDDAEVISDLVSRAIKQHALEVVEHESGKVFTVYSGNNCQIHAIDRSREKAILRCAVKAQFGGPFVPEDALIRRPNEKSHLAMRG